MNSHIALQKGREFGAIVAKSRVIGELDTPQDRTELFHEALDIARDEDRFTPGSSFEAMHDEISEMGPQWKRDLLWAMFDEGIEDGIKDALDKWAEQPHECLPYAMEEHIDGIGNAVYCGRCGRFINRAPRG